MSNKVLLEIGTEEIPSKQMPNLLKQFKENAQALMKENRIGVEEINSYGTPRRLVLYMDGVDDKQQDLIQLIKGPSKKAGFTEDGEPTKAALGFAKGQGVRVEDLVIEDGDGGTYLFANKTNKGIPSRQALESILPQAINSLAFNVSMRWGRGNMRFIRPVRWILALFNDNIIPFEIENLKSGRSTRGHRFLGSPGFEVSGADEYFDRLMEQYVIVDQNKRKEMILSQSREIASSLDGSIMHDQELLEEVTYLIEYPTALYGRFEEKYLKLPREVVITPMKEHQKYFPVMDKEGKLLPCFITVRNGSREHLDIVREGNEKVLRARLADAEFFYNEDKDKPLESNVEKLKNVVYQEKLGTVYDKTMRIERAAGYLALETGLEMKERNNLMAAAFICKSDLVTEMVKEFDELQGIMAREYALLQGKAKETAYAVYEHYLPRYSGDDLPESLIGALLGIADRIDTIAGCFSIGLQPTGSQDPYALRRHAIGIINIIREKGINLSLKNLVCNALEPFVERGCIKKDDKEPVTGRIMEFFMQRFRNILIDKGFRYDVIDAVLASGFDYINHVSGKCEAVMECLGDERFEGIISALNRVNNLSRNSEHDNVVESLFEDECEGKLWDPYQQVKTKVSAHLRNNDYFNAITAFSGLVQPINSFFDTTMVMVKDEAVRNNRLALLKSIVSLMNNIMDISRLVV